MQSNRIEEIVQKVHEKAKANCTSRKKFALATYVSEHTDLSYRTIQRTFDRYINQLDEVEPSQTTVDLLCNFLGFENYAAFINGNGRDEVKSKGLKKKIFIAITLAFVSILAVTFYLNQNSSKKYIVSPTECMVWSKTHYEKVTCDKSYGKKIEPIDPVKLANFRKIEVTIATTFFDENTKRPLVWYNKTKEGDIEYFTAPGLHPITGKTLDEITTYIIDKYVPKHVYKADSFLEVE